MHGLLKKNTSFYRRNFSIAAFALVVLAVLYVRNFGIPQQNYILGISNLFGSFGYAEGDGGGDGDSGAGSGDAGTGPGGDSGTGPGDGSGDAGTSPGGDAGTGPGGDTGTGPGVDAGTGRGGDSGTGPGGDASTGPGADTGTGPGGDTSTGPGGDAEAGPGADVGISPGEIGGGDVPVQICEDQNALNFGGPLPCVFPQITATSTLAVTKIVINDNGGTKLVADFPLFINSTQVSSDVAYDVAPGDFIVSETNDATKYTATIGGDCDSSGHVAVSLGENKTCTITNNDNPPVITPSTLTVIKVVINDNSGTSTVTRFPLFVNGNPVTSGQVNTLTPGTYTVTETSQPNYTASFSGGCNASGQATLAAGENKTCTITNNDNPPATPPSLICAISLDPSTIAPSANSTLSWTYNALSAVIDKGIGAVGPNGSTTVTAIINTTFTGIFSNAVASTTCQALLTVSTGGGGGGGGGGGSGGGGGGGSSGGGGGGGGMSPIITLTKQIQPLAFISLSQVPYTGIGDNVQLVIFLINLALISWFIARWLAGASPVAAIKSVFLASNAPSALKNFAHTAEVAVAMPAALPIVARDAYATGVGAFPVAPLAAEVNVPAFITAVALARERQAFEMLRTLESRGASVEEFMKDAVQSVAAVYLSRRGERYEVDPAVNAIFAGWDLVIVEAFLAGLLVSVDASFASGWTAAKVAISNAARSARR